MVPAGDAWFVPTVIPVPDRKIGENDYVAFRSKADAEAFRAGTRRCCGGRRSSPKSRTRRAGADAENARAAAAGRQHAAPGDPLSVARPAADGVRQVRAAQPDGQHQGPDGAAHPRRGDARRHASRPATPSSRRPAATPASRSPRSAARFGHPVTIFMPDWMSRERRDLIASFGARIVTVSREEGGFLGCIARAEALAADDPRVFLPSQFSNEANPIAHEATTGPEILEQLASSGVRLDAFVAGVGTGGTVMGVGRVPAPPRRADPRASRSSRRSRRRCRPGTSAGSTASRGSPTSSSPRSSTSPS